MQTATIVRIVLLSIVGGLSAAYASEQDNLIKDGAAGRESRTAMTADEWMGLLPEDEGKILVATYCAMCHSLQYAVVGSRDRNQWLHTVEKMVLEHDAPISDEEIDLIADYLSKHSGVDNPIASLPLDVNSVSAAALDRLPFLTNDEIEVILQFRTTHGPIKDLRQLESVIEAGKISKLSAYLVAQ